MDDVVNTLIKEGKTISTMESCTGGYISNLITNVEGSSQVFMFGAVTYSNLYKLKLGVSKEVIDKYSVYSKQCARCMSKSISDFTNSDYGVGVTGKLNRIDKENLFGEDNAVFISVFDRCKDVYFDKEMCVNKDSRPLNKEMVSKEVIDLILSAI